MKILLFDMDGVLLEPNGYHLALKETVRLVSRSMGFEDFLLSDQDIACDNTDHSDRIIHDLGNIMAHGARSVLGLPIHGANVGIESADAVSLADLHPGRWITVVGINAPPICIMGVRIGLRSVRRSVRVGAAHHAHIRSGLGAGSEQSGSTGLHGGGSIHGTILLQEEVQGHVAEIYGDRHGRIRMRHGRDVHDRHGI